MAEVLEKTRKHLLINQMRYFTQEGNFTKNDFPEMDVLLKDIHSEVRKGAISKDDIQLLRSCFDRDFLRNTIQGRGLQKPNGYAGDYLLLDKIYTRHISDNKKYSAWDEYFQQHAAPRSVRNRKEYFKNLMLSKHVVGGQLNLMNVVSGSGRELYETYAILPENKKVKTTCVEVDGHAVEYSKHLNSDFLDDIEYVHSNIFKFRNKKKYDFIWSAGLFDYLDDKAFLMLLTRFKSWLVQGGEIVIGNYNKNNNPSRNYMEVLGDWYLIHRTEEELKELARKAGFRNDQIWIGRERLNVNLFLHIKLN